MNREKTHLKWAEAINLCNAFAVYFLSSIKFYQSIQGAQSGYYIPNYLNR